MTWRATHRGCCCSMLRMCTSIGISTSGACPLRKWSPRIVRRRYDNRDNNEVVDFSVPRQDIRSAWDICVPHAYRTDHQMSTRENDQDSYVIHVSRSFLALA